MQQVRDSTYHIIDYKGATYYAVGLALVRIVGAILRNQRSVLTVSTVLDGEYGLQDVHLSVPSVITQEDIASVLVADLAPDEREARAHSAMVIRETIDALDRKVASGGFVL